VERLTIVLDIKLRYRTKMIAVSRSKKLNVINIIMFKNDARSLARRVTTWRTVSKIVDTPVNPSLFGINSVYQMETSLSHALLVY
jgi:hypothetical protein